MRKTSFLPVTLTLIFAFGLLASCDRRQPPPPPLPVLPGGVGATTVSRADMHNPDALVDVAMLMTMDMSNVVIVDVSPSPHNVIPGAIWLDRNLLYREIDGNNVGIETIETHERVFGAHGIGNNTTVILYDDANGMHAARIFWQFRAMGHRDVRLLNGGLGAWLAAGHPVLANAAAPGPAVSYTAFNNMGILRAELDRVLAAKHNPAYTILDTRSQAEWDAGRIPGSVQSTFPADFLNADFTFKPLHEYEQMFAHIPRNTTLILYCGGGLRASIAYYVFTHIMGWPQPVLLYEGGWNNYTWAGAPIEW